MNNINRLILISQRLARARPEHGVARVRQNDLKDGTATLPFCWNDILEIRRSRNASCFDHNCRRDAVMSFGGFLGMGESYHPLPWKTLTYSTNLGGYCVDLDRARLERSPHYTMSTQPDWSDRAYRDRIDQYWIRPL
jgi:hypothetical protein